MVGREREKPQRWGVDTLVPQQIGREQREKERIIKPTEPGLGRRPTHRKKKSQETHKTFSLRSFSSGCSRSANERGSDREQKGRPTKRWEKRKRTKLRVLDAPSGKKSWGAEKNCHKVSKKTDSGIPGIAAKTNPFVRAERQRTKKKNPSIS